MFYFISCTIYYLEKAIEDEKLPHHQKIPLLGEIINFLILIQDSDSPIIGGLHSLHLIYYIFTYSGVLSGLLLASLDKAGAHIGSLLAKVPMSPSFYQPACLEQYSKHYNEIHIDLVHLSDPRISATLALLSLHLINHERIYFIYKE